MIELTTAGYVYVSALVAAFGACIGSFLNVCIHRIPREESIVRPRSRCPRCAAPIRWFDNVPLLSYAVLGGRCRHCGVRIAPRYVLVEALVGMLFLLVWLRLAVTGEARPLGLPPLFDAVRVPIYWLMIAGLVLGAFVDLEHMIIPDRVTLGGLAAGLALSALAPSLHDTSARLTALSRSAVGAAAGWGLLWALGAIGTAVFRKPAMGFGDVKLMGAIGAFLGWEAVVFTMVVSSFFGSIVGVGLIAAGRKRLQGRIPYGPYLALAAVLWVLWGSGWWQWYLDLLVRGRGAGVALSWAAAGGGF